METNDIGAPSKWIPISDPVKLAGLGKLIEECGELSAIAGRCIIQGMLGVDPSTGKVNREALIDEIADVYALSQVAFKYVLHLEEAECVEMLRRAQRKMEMKDAWLEMLK